MTQEEKEAIIPPTQHQDALANITITSLSDMDRRIDELSSEYNNDYNDIEVVDDFNTANSSYHDESEYTSDSSSDDSSSSDESEDSEEYEVKSTPKRGAARKTPVSTPRKRKSVGSDSDSDDVPSKKARASPARKTKVAAAPSKANSSASSGTLGVDLGLTIEEINADPALPVKIKLKDPDEITIYRYFRVQNRPYNIQQIFDNLRETIRRVVVNRSIEKLTQDGYLTEKVVGKAKIYHVNQDHMPGSDPEKIKEIDERLKATSKEYDEKRMILMKLRNEVNLLEATPTNEEGDSLVNEKNQEFATKTARLESILNNTTANDQESIDIIKYRYHRSVIAWRKRRNAVYEMMDRYLENVTKTQKAFINEKGIDTDEMMKQDLKEYLQLSEKLACNKVRFPTVKK